MCDFGICRHCRHVESSTVSTVPEALYNRLAPLVPAIARRVKQRCPMSIDLEDLEQSGRAALWAVCVHFDPAREATFTQYAKMRIRGAMLDWIRGPEFREATRERDAIRIDMSQDVSSGQSGQCGILPGYLPKPCDPFISRAVDRLGGRQAAVMGLRFYAGLSRSETGERIGISCGAVARAERSAIQSLRELLTPRAA